MSKTVEDYDSMAKREMIKAKQEKALMFVYQFSTADSQRSACINGRTYVAGVFKSSEVITMNSRASLNGSRQR